MTAAARAITRTSRAAVQERADLVGLGSDFAVSIAALAIAIAACRRSADKGMPT